MNAPADILVTPSPYGPSAQGLVAKIASAFTFSHSIDQSA
jgi:hypothetical protein